MSEQREPPQGESSSEPSRRVPIPQILIAGGISVVLIAALVGIVVNAMQGLAPKSLSEAAPAAVASARGIDTDASPALLAHQRAQGRAWRADVRRTLSDWTPPEREGAQLSSVELYEAAKTAVHSGHCDQGERLLRAADLRPVVAAEPDRQKLAALRAGAPRLRAVCVMESGRCDDGVVALRASGATDIEVAFAVGAFCGSEP